MKRFILALIFLSSPLLAAVSHQIDTATPLRCSFSLNHHNRILIEGGRVKKVIFPEDRLFIRLEEVSGQVFIQTKNPSKETVLISVITQEGLVQDLEIAFTERPSQVIILNNLQTDAPLECTAQAASCENNSLNSVISAILRGESPRGYNSLPIRKCSWRPKKGIRAKLVGCLSNYQEDLYIYHLANTSWMTQQICEKELTYPGVHWAYIDKKSLEGKEKTLAILSICHDKEI